MFVDWGILSDKWTGLSFTIASAVILGFKSHETHDHILIQIRESPNIEGQVPVFISHRNRVAQLYSQVLGSFLVPSYNSQGYGGGVRAHLHTGDIAACLFVA
jgi:hypothetical protein